MLGFESLGRRRQENQWWKVAWHVGGEHDWRRWRNKKPYGVAMRKTKSSTGVTWRKKSVRTWRNKLVAGSRAPISEGLCIYRRVLN
jgi:hypothetical protein